MCHSNTINTFYDLNPYLNHRHQTIQSMLNSPPAMQVFFLIQAQISDRESGLRIPQIDGYKRQMQHFQIDDHIITVVLSVSLSLTHTHTSIIFWTTYTKQKNVSSKTKGLTPTLYTNTNSQLSDLITFIHTPLQQPLVAQTPQSFLLSLL